MMNNAPIPQDLRMRVERELESGERILWMGMPVPRAFSGPATGAFLFGIPWTAFAIFWTCGAAGFKMPDLNNGLKGFELFPLFGLPFILIGLGMLSSPFWARRKALRTVFVITDLRAISFEGGRSTTIRSYRPEQLRDVYRKERSGGLGDVIITQRGYKDSDGNQKSEELGFMNIRQPYEIEKMLKNLGRIEEQPRI